MKQSRWKVSSKRGSYVCKERAILRKEMLVQNAHWKRGGKSISESKDRAL
jgi:hypothetical protein